MITNQGREPARSAFIHFALPPALGPRLDARGARTGTETREGEEWAWFFEGYKSVLPFLVNDEPAPTRERRQSPAERARYDDTTKCILCAACTTSCPIYWSDESDVGPAAIVNAHRFVFDSRDRASDERLEILGERTGACPRGIRVTRAIQEVKREILDRAM